MLIIRSVNSHTVLGAQSDVYTIIHLTKLKLMHFIREFLEIEKMVSISYVLGVLVPLVSIL